MTDIIEQDALISTPQDPPPIAHDHAHEEVKSFVAMPRQNTNVLQKMVAWMRGTGNPDAPIVYKSADGLRRMFLITSNSYEDRDGETITSDALKAYEESCYPGEDLYHNDNPLLWWHDDEIVMGEIVAVEYIEPFLVEVAKEIDDPLAKILWDYAEKNGDKAGTSHRFGYLEKDRDPDGTFHRIFKQETSYLPQRSLAANDRTYAGVIAPMSIPESRKRLSTILSEATQVEDWAELIRDEGIPAVKKRLLASGVQHKAFPPKQPAAVPPPVLGEEIVETEEIEEDAEDTPPEKDGRVDMARMMVLLNGVLDMFAGMMDTQAASEMDRVGMMKAFDELKEMRVSEKAQESVTMSALEEKVKALEARVVNAEKTLALTPRRAADQTPLDPKAVEAVIQKAESDRVNGELLDTPFGKLKPPIKYE